MVSFKDRYLGSFEHGLMLLYLVFHTFTTIFDFSLVINVGKNSKSSPQEWPFYFTS